MKKNNTGSKRKFVVGLLAAILVLAVGAMVFCGCADKGQGYRPESPSVIGTPPKSGSPEDYSALDNIAFVIGKLNSRKQYHSENRNTATATSLGIINVKQTVVGSKDYKDGLLITSTVSTSSTSLAPSKAIQKFYGDKKVVVRTAASNKPADWNGLKTKWSAGEPSEILDETQYEAKYGLWASEFTDYVINEKTLLTKDAKPVKNGDKYELTVSLSVGANNTEDATFYYKKQMKTMGELSEGPQFDEVSLTIVFGADWSVSSVRTRESYTSKKGVITASCKGEAEITFSYDAKSADVSAYEEYFSKYASAPTKDDDGEKEMTAMDYIGEGLIPVLNGKSTLSMQLNVAGNLVEGYARLEMNEASLSKLLVKTPQTQFVYTDDVLYAVYDKAVAKLTVSELKGALPDLGASADKIVSAIENGVLEKDGGLVTVSCVLPLDTGDLPLVFGFGEADGKVEWKYINAGLSVFGQEISATVEPSSETVRFDTVAADDAVDMTSFAKDLADFSNLKALTGAADYTTDAQDVHVDAVIENSAIGLLPVKADVAVSVQNYKTDETGAVIRDENNLRTPDGGHFVHAILTDDGLYLSYSLVALDAETALRVKISLLELIASGGALMQILNDFSGFDLGGVLSAAITQESAPIALNSLFATGVGAAFTAQTDAAGDHSIGLENASINGGTLALTLNAVKNADYAAIAVPDVEYKDIDFLSQLITDFANTAANKATGFNLTGEIYADLLGEDNVMIGIFYDARIGINENGEVYCYISLNIEKGSLAYGTTFTDIVVKDGLVVINRTQTAKLNYDTLEQEALETPIVSSHVLTLSQFLADIGNELMFALNINPTILDELMGMAGDTQIGAGLDLGELIQGIAGDKTGYYIDINLGTIMQVMNLGVKVQIGRNNDTSMLTNIKIDLGIGAGGFNFVNAKVTMTNNNPGEAVDFTALDRAVAEAAKTFGCADFDALAQKVAENGGVLRMPEPEPTPEPTPAPAA